MKFEEIEFENVLVSHIKIFMFLATKYLRTLTGYDREDLIQEQMIACYKAIDKYNNHGKLSSFIYAVSENHLKSIYRSEMRQKRKPKQISYIESAKFEEVGLILADKSPSIEDHYYIDEVRSKLELVAKQSLSKFEYLLYVELIIHQKSVKELATELNKSEKQVANGLTRLRKKLREKRKFIIDEIWYN